MIDVPELCLAFTAKHSTTNKTNAARKRNHV